MQTESAAAALSALAQPTRLRVFRALVTAGPAGLPAGALSRRVGAVPATLSFHLKELAHARLIEARRDGRNVIYAVSAERMRALVAFLALDCCGGKPEICGLTFKRAASSKRPKARALNGRHRAQAP
jgi:DNA-binding transcriptional ArsR family regulator